jgi:hypothetical protein
MTEDGARLTPEHLAIVEIAAQGQLHRDGHSGGLCYNLKCLP